MDRAGNVPGMSYVGRNVRWYMDRHELKEPQAAKALGVSQSTINRMVNPGSSRPNRDPSQATLLKISQGMGVTVDALVNTDLSTGMRVEDSRAPYLVASQPMQPDLDRLGVALTAIDRALRDVRIQGKLGQLAEAVKYAYLETFSMANIHDAAQRQLFDRLVAAHLRDWDGQAETGTAGQGTDQDRRPAAARKATGGGR